MEYNEHKSYVNSFPVILYIHKPQGMNYLQK